MKRPSAKRVSLYAGIAVSVVTVLWKVTPTMIRVATVPDKLDALTVKVDAAAKEDAVTARELAEMRGEITTIRHLLQGRAFVGLRTNYMHYE
jgi:hypothetical protein